MTMPKSFKTEYTFILGFVFCIFFLYVYPLEIFVIKNNVCNICRSKLTQTKTGECGLSLTELNDYGGFFCSICSTQNELTLSEEVFISAKAFNQGEYRVALDESEFEDFRILWSNYAITTTYQIPVGLYEIQVHAKNDRPGPVILQVIVNQQSLGQLIFDKDDNSWSTKCLYLHPIHWRSMKNQQIEAYIEVYFKNDGGDIYGGDGSRDAGVAWLKLIPLTNLSNIDN